MIFEAYRSSAVTSTVFVGDANSGLMKMTAFTELKPWYFNSTQITEKHNSAVWHYLWSFSFNPPLITGTMPRDGRPSVTTRASNWLFSCCT